MNQNPGQTWGNIAEKRNRVNPPTPETQVQGPETPGRVRDRNQRSLENEHGKVRVNFWLTKKMHSFVEEISSRDGRSMSDIIREAIREYMSKHPIQNKDED